MAYIVVTKDRPPEGRAQLVERVGSADFEADHFRSCLSERLAWAVEDAERALPEPEPEPQVEPGRAAHETGEPVLARV
jgi:hypothetical protein